MGNLFGPMALFGGGPSVSPSSSAGISAAGSEFSLGRGDWNVNVAGSGQAVQGLSAGGINWTLVAIAAAAWFLLKK
jgi:hypothetical protein